MISGISQIRTKLKNSRFFKDSFWAVFGNGIGYGLMLLAGIVIARLLGKDLYGEYGFVKTTMFQFAAFSTLGLGYTSTKFVAEFKSKNPRQVRPIINASIRITSAVSCTIALLLILFAHPLARYLNQPDMSLALQVLGFIVVVRALNTTQFGILAGFGNFKVMHLLFEYFIYSVHSNDLFFQPQRFPLLTSCISNNMRSFKSSCHQSV